MDRRLIFIIFLTSLILFGTNGVVAEMISLPSNQIVLFRTAVGSLFLLIVTLIVTRKSGTTVCIGQLPYTIASGASMGISWILLYESYTMIGVGMSSILYYCGPALVMFLSPLIFNERLTVKGIVGLTTVMVGASLICMEALEPESEPMGYVYAIGSAIAHAVMVICGKKVTVTGGLENSSIQMTVAFLMVFVYSIMISDLPTYVNGDDWIPILVLGVLNTGIGCFMYFLTIPKLEAQTISIWGYLEPLSALVAGMMFLGEQILVVQIAGVVLILFGTIGTGLLGRRVRINSHDVIR